MTKSVVRNKDFSADIARACKMPQNQARKCLSIILETMANGLKKDKILKIRDFATFKLWRPKRTHLPSGRFVPAVKWRCDISPKGKLNRVLKNKWWSDYCWFLVEKYNRLTKEGDIKYAKEIKKRLRSKLRGNWSMARWLDDRGRLPYPLWKKRVDDV